MDEFRVKTINDITVVIVELVMANALDCFKTLQEALHSNHSESPIRDVNSNQESSLY